MLWNDVPGSANRALPITRLRPLQSPCPTCWAATKVIMFGSRVDRFNIVDATPFKRDPVKELAAACAKRGIRFGVSLNLKVMSVERAARLEKAVRGLQPDCLISGRLGGDSQSDYASEGDNSIPNLSRAGAWETPATLNDTWCFKKNDHNWKKPETLIFKLAGIVSKGGNYLLNVGPDGEGVIPQPGQDVLRAVGRWLKVNGESIYEAGRSPFGAEFGEYSSTAKDRRGRPLFRARTGWRCTTRPGRLYLHLFQWPAGAFELKGVQGRAAKAYLLAGPRRGPLGIKQAGAAVSIQLPRSTPDNIDSVLVLELTTGRGPANWPECRRHRPNLPPRVRHA